MNTQPKTMVESMRIRFGAPAVDVAAMLALLLVGIVAFGPVFSGAPGYVAAAGGVVIGTTIASVSAWRGWSFLGTATVSGLAYFVLGGLLALPETTIGGVLPTLQTLQRLALLTYQAWRDLLTVSVPASTFTGPAVVPYVSGLVCSVLTVSAALRLRRHLWAILPALVLLVIGILWGTKDAPTAALQGLVFIATAMGWAAWRTGLAQQRASAALLTVRPSTSRAVRQRLAAGAAILTIAGSLALVAGPSLADSTDRYVLRDHVVPPLDLQDYASPLTRYRYYERQLKSKPLFTVSGLPKGARVRLAGLDVYDGHVYNVDKASADFARVGKQIESDGEHRATRLQVRIAEYRGVWVPGAGQLSGLRFHGARSAELEDGTYYNADTGTALTTASLHEGDSYDVDVDLSAPPADARLARDSIASLDLPVSRRVPDEIVSEAPTFGGSSSTPIATVRKLEAKFRAVGFYSNDGKVSTAGHYSRRLAQMFEASKMVGDDEQYAATMALVLRQLNIPARVVLGFYPEKYTGGTQSITGNDAHVWVEVPFRNAGWVPFDPTPDRDKQPDTKVPKPEERPRPQVLPPPVPPREPVEPPQDRTDKSSLRQKDATKLPEAVKLVGYVAAGGVLLASPFLLVAGIKARRRRRRRTTGPRVERIHGGWSEVLDAATDWGATPSPRVTRQESAAELAQGFPDSAPQAVAVAIDAKVFGHGEPTDEDVTEMWKQVDVLLGQMRGTLSPWRRARGLLSVRSLLPRARGVRG